MEGRVGQKDVKLAGAWCHVRATFDSSSSGRKRGRTENAVEMPEGDGGTRLPDVVGVTRRASRELFTARDGDCPLLSTATAPSSNLTTRCPQALACRRGSFVPACHNMDIDSIPASGAASE